VGSTHTPSDRPRARRDLEPVSDDGGDDAQCPHARTTAGPPAHRHGGDLDHPTQNAELTALSFDERFALLVDAEWRARENKRLGRALRDAKLKLPHASIEAIDDPARRELDKAVIRQLATCRWVDEPQPVLISGAPGVGKTFIACALGNQACRKGYRARYWRASRLYHACALARADGTYGRFLGQLARVDVLVLD
jgi:DNA replication protein DnaC